MRNRGSGGLPRCRRGGGDNISVDSHARNSCLIQVLLACYRFAAYQLRPSRRAVHEVRFGVGEVSVCGGQEHEWRWGGA